MNEWISVEDRLPEDVYGKSRKQIQVLVCTRSGRIGTASRVRKFDFRIKNWYETENFEWNKSKLVTHWMPLPEPPKEENK